MDSSQEYTASGPTKLERRRKSIEGRIRKDLITFVKLGDSVRSFARYERLARKFKLPYETKADRDYLDDILTDICRYEHEHGRSMLSIVVVNEEFTPGLRFSVIAKQLKRQKPTESDNEFISRERAELFEYWWKTHKDPIRKERRESKSRGR